MSFEELLTKYALPSLAMAAIVLVIIGIVKIFTKMIPNKKHQEAAKVSKVMSYFYVLMAMACSFGVVCGYHWLWKLGWQWVKIAEESLSVFACSQALYPIYRDYGGRWLLTKFLQLFKGKDTKTDEVISIIEKVMILTDSQKAKISEELHKDL